MATTKTTNLVWRGADIIKDGTSVETRTNRFYNYSSTRTGNENPNWRQNILDNKNATTALQGVLRTFRVTPMEARGTYTFGGNKWDNYLTGPHLGTSMQAWATTMTVPALTKNLQIAEAQAKARTYASRRLAKYQDPFKGAQETLGELRETVRLLRHPLDTFTKLTKNMAQSIEGARKGRGRSRDLAIKSLGESVLEFNFGIVPLVREIATIKDIIEDHLLEFREKNRTYGRSSVYTTTSFSSTAGLGLYQWDTTVTIEAYAECFIHFGILIEKLLTHDQLLNKIPDELSKLETLPSLMWEFTPMSVFVDYVVNVGDIIQAATQATGAISYNSESNVYTLSKSQVHSRLRTSTAGATIIPTVYSNVILKERSVNRVGGNLGIPPMVFHLPGSNISYMNIAALIASANFNPKNHVRLQRHSVSDL